MLARPIAALSLLLALGAPMLATSEAQPAKSQPVERPVAIVGDKTVGWSQLAPLMAEAAGGQVLEEFALGVILKDECQKRQIKIGDAEIRAERTLLSDTIATAAGAPTTEGETLLTRVRRTRGLGELRFKGLLERNAALRAMVRAGIGDAPITISDADIDTAYQLKYGPRVRARLILVATEDAAKKALARINSGQTFAEVAGDVSLDPSSSRGGMLDAFNLSDSSYPVAVRKTLLNMTVGNTSEPLGVTWGGTDTAPERTGFAIVRLEESIPAPATAPTREAAAKDLEQEIRIVRERAAMDVLARKLLKSSAISAMDSSLGWSWEGRTGGK